MRGCREIKWLPVSIPVHTSNPIVLNHVGTESLRLTAHYTVHTKAQTDLVFPFLVLPVWGKVVYLCLSLTAYV